MKHVLLTLVLFLILVLLLAPKAQPKTKDYKVYVVQKGDTLWSIASKHYPGQHTGQKLYEIRKINGLENPVLQVGQKILLPKEG